MCAFVRDETEASRSLRVGISHHNTVDYLAPFLKVVFQAFIGRLVAETSDKQLTELFRFTFIVLQQEQSTGYNWKLETVISSETKGVFTRNEIRTDIILY